jgi:tripartite-type tricarboxylate transporter receptor subunit TctC
MRAWLRLFIASFVATATLAVAATPSLSQKVDFGGQKITLAIATPPGGGYDLYGRLAGRFLGAYLPGNPTIVPQNMPGAGSLIAANWLYNVASRDGSAIGIIPSATAIEK